MMLHTRRNSLVSQQPRFRMWFVLMVIMSLPLWVGGCGREDLDKVLAEVNGQRITMKNFRDELARMPEEMRAVSEQDPGEVLDRLISLKLLLQEAKRKGLVDSAELRGLNNSSVQEGMRRLLEPEIKDVKVADQEVAAFYQQHRDEMERKSLSQVREAIRRMLLEQKQQQRISDVVARLRANSAITAFPERLPKPPPPVLEASTAEAFQAALQSGKPTVVDFGSNRCIPCIQLRPVMRAVRDAYNDRINVLFLEIGDHRDLARHYKVQLIPTLIFFDARGREVQRKMGFMNRAAMEKTLRDLGFLEG